MKFDTDFNQRLYNEVLELNRKDRTLNPTLQKLTIDNFSREVGLGKSTVSGGQRSYLKRLPTISHSEILDLEIIKKYFQVLYNKFTIDGLYPNYQSFLPFLEELEKNYKVSPSLLFPDEIILTLHFSEDNRSGHYTKHDLMGKNYYQQIISLFNVYKICLDEPKDSDALLFIFLEQFSYEHQKDSGSIGAFTLDYLKEQSGIFKQIIDNILKKDSSNFFDIDFKVENQRSKREIESIIKIKNNVINTREGVTRLKSYQNLIESTINEIKNLGLDANKTEDIKLKCSNLLLLCEEQNLKLKNYYQNELDYLNTKLLLLDDKHKKALGKPVVQKLNIRPKI